MSAQRMTHRTALMWSPTFFPYFFSTSLRFMARGSNTMHKWFLWKKCLNSFIIGIQFKLFSGLRYYKKQKSGWVWKLWKNSPIFLKNVLKKILELVHGGLSIFMKKCQIVSHLTLPEQSDTMVFIVSVRIINSS